MAMLCLPSRTLESMIHCLLIHVHLAHKGHSQATLRALWVTGTARGGTT